MRAITRYALAPLFIAAAFLTAGLTAGAPAQAATPAAIPHILCPGGTSWDNILHMCR